MSAFRLRCVECGGEYPEDPHRLVCPVCAARQVAGGPTRGVLEVVLEELPEAWPDAGPAEEEPFLRTLLPLPEVGLLPPVPVGDTPLLPAPGLRSSLALSRLWVKDDTRNPSGSTKDRASWLVVAKALEYGFETIAAASTGNAATALAAIAAASGLRAVVFVPAGAPEAKLVQMLSYGALVIPVAGTYDEAFELCAGACDAFGWYNRNTALNPFTIEGKKTAAVEVAASLHPEAPDVVIVPTGDGVILSGVAKGFADLRVAGLSDATPRLIAVQPEGSAAIVRAWRDGSDTLTPLERAESVADSLTVACPRNALMCLRRIRESEGAAVAVPDDAILEAIPTLARTTGVFAEPAAAASLAGLRAALEAGLVSPTERIVLLVTGSGLKDVPAAARGVRLPPPIEPDLEAVAALVAR